MFSQISPKYYYDPTIFDSEQKHLFRHNWIFVGFKNELANHNDFITKKIGNIPIVVQNFKGEIKALLNVCSHRFSLIQTKSCGNRPLLCPYHGWAYDKKGIPCGIPKKPLFTEFSPSQLDDLKLKKYQVDFCGDLCFVKVNYSNQTLKEYLGEFYNELEVLSTSKSVCVDTNTLDINSNWKVIVENTLESYHVNLVHSNTFRKLGASGLDFSFSEKHSKWTAPLALNEDDPKLKSIHSKFKNRKLKIDGYEHYLIYPNLLISTSYGVSYNFSLIEPITEDKTKFTSYVYLADHEETPLTKAYAQSLVDFNREVFDEDKEICEFVQEGVKHTDQPGVLSLEEKRVHSFQNHYIKQIV